MMTIAVHIVVWENGGVTLTNQRSFDLTKETADELRQQFGDAYLELENDLRSKFGFKLLPQPSLRPIA